ncbi:hypothetical protein LI168_02995 [Desulfovibrio desulfuricans]|uniref:hypothetical protein n=1 Tax=Desulfovibrio desulfuricans TaxID=876 RepID=UPI001D079507|nr:hypothetical protein [Desulfovibrio desulfuricans]MCB6541102.1 hypothetical protein [Desulfovibrio desulfuricans]MCB6552184.1 hypothetical protein [Desulfovibrio desulfuricans]MCB6564027.1 hypothetical protein [Desulfovibrio desulfuricans]MCB7345207.1 hypothetical protein [Desulfovibrio desulfuricans]MCQ5217339.1 hypothetical protein [Desulfovibrio desulfuricans]
MNQAALMKRIEREALKTNKQARKIAKLTKQAINTKSEKCSNCGAENVPLSIITDDSNIAISTQRIALCPTCRGIS